MDIVMKSKELGIAISVSNEMIDLKKAEIEVENDDKARVLLYDFKLLQLQITQNSINPSDKENMENLQERLKLKHEEVYINDTARNYLETRSRFDNLMKKVNDVMVYAITGEAPCSEDGCSSCKRCN